MHTAVCNEGGLRYRDVAAVSARLGDRLYGLRPCCRGDAVAKLLGVLLVGEPLRLDDTGMIAAALDNARAAFRCGE